MQNVINSMAPFTDPLTGLPLSGGRVSFVMLDTDDRTRYIDIKDVDGTSLENPLPLDDSGRFTIQPFVADNTDFKMIVERRVTAPLPVPLWEEVYVVFQKHQHVEVSYDGCPVVDSVADLRNLDTDNGKAIVLGYWSAGDFCPARTFVWDGASGDTENYGTHITSNLVGVSGCWIANPGDVVDVRWFGINPSLDTNECSARLAVISDEYSSDATIYFPAGNYHLSESVAFNSVIVEKGANFKVADGEGTVTFTATHLDNRGGMFLSVDSADYSSARVVLKTKGLLRSSWLGGTINEFLTSGALADIDEIIFDSITSNGTTAVTITGKRVVQKVALPNSITFSDCERYMTSTGALEATILGFADVLRMGGNYNTKLDTGDGAIHVRHNANDIMTFTNALVSILKSLSIQNFKLNSDNEGWAEWNDGSDWDGQLFILAAKAAISQLRANDFLVNNSMTCNGSALFMKGLRETYETVIVHTNGDCTIDDAAFDGKDRLLVEIKVGAGCIVNITATSAIGKEIKIIAVCSDSVNYGSTFYVAVQVAGTEKYVLHSGSSAVFIPGLSTWSVDLSRL